MNQLEDHKPVSISGVDLENLMEHLKNNEYRCILQRPKPIDFVCNSGMQLLHLAIAYKNLELIEFLSDDNDNVNTKNVTGDTALLVALKSNNFEAVKILLDADADVRVTDWATRKNALGLLLTKRRKVISDIVPHFVKNLIRSKFEIATLVEVFIDAECSFEYVCLMNDAQLNQEFLKRNTSGDLDLNMNLAMERRDFGIVELIMRYGNKSGKLAFYRNLSDFCTTNRLGLWKDFIERFINWDVISIETLTHFDCMFRTASTEYLQILLECGIHEQLKDKFKVDLRVVMFGNRWIDAIELLRKQNFEINAQSLMQESALHLAVKNNLVKNVSFLLNSGANPNIKDERGRTALFDCTHQQNDIKYTELLLAHGANVQVADNNGLTIFEAGKNNFCLLKYLIAQLAIDVLKGVTIKPMILDQILSNRAYQTIYESCFEELSFLNKWSIAAPVIMESVEEYAVSKYVSFFTVLTDKIEKFYRHVNIQDVMCLLDQCNSQYSNLHGLYYSTLTIKLIKASNLYRFKCDIANVISKNTGKFVDFDHLATRNISEYLSDKDIEQFVDSLCCKPVPEKKCIDVPYMSNGIIIM